MPATEERINKLEAAVEHFIHSVGVEFNKAYNSNEIFKADVTAFKDEMKDFKDEMKDFKNEMKDFKNEMKDFKDEIRGFNRNVWKIINDMKKQYGDMVRKLGTIVEDLVLPSIPVQILSKFGFELEQFSINIKVKRNGMNQEYDAIGIYKDTVFLNSTKTTLREKNIEELKQMIQNFTVWFPEHKGKKLIGILAAFDISDSVKSVSEKAGFLVMGVSGNIMEIWNSPDFIPRYYEL